MKKFTKLFGLVVLGMLFAQAAVAQRVHTAAADASPAIRIFNDTGATLTIVVSGTSTNYAVTVDGQANTVDASGAAVDTITELAAAIGACTNASGKALTAFGNTEVDADPSLSADSSDDEILDGTYTAADNRWLTIPWDTSSAKFYSVYLQDSATRNSGTANYRIKRIVGYPTGTGAVTVTVYTGGTLAAQRVYPVVNVPSAVGEGTNGAYVASADVNIDWELDMPVQSSQAVIVRATRATTATTGNLSVITE